MSGAQFPTELNGLGGKSYQILGDSEQHRAIPANVRAISTIAQRVQPLFPPDFGEASHEPGQLRAVAPKICKIPPSPFRLTPSPLPICKAPSPTHPTPSRPTPPPIDPPMNPSIHPHPHTQPPAHPPACPPARPLAHTLFPCPSRYDGAMGHGPQASNNNSAVAAGCRD